MSRALRSISTPATPVVRAGRACAAERVLVQQRKLSAAVGPGAGAGAGGRTRGCGRRRLLRRRSRVARRSPLRAWEGKGGRRPLTTAPARLCRVLVRLASDGTLVYSLVGAQARRGRARSQLTRSADDDGT